MAKLIQEIKIDKTEHNGKLLYRYHIECEDGSSIGSCFCNESLEEAMFMCINALDVHLGYSILKEEE